MDDTTDSNSNGGGAWLGARLGNAIDVFVDRQLSAAQAITPSTGYGLDQNGNLYKLGQPSTVQTVSPVGGGSMGLLLVAGLLFLVMHRG